MSMVWVEEKVVQVRPWNMIRGRNQMCVCFFFSAARDLDEKQLPYPQLLSQWLWRPSDRSAIGECVHCNPLWQRVQPQRYSPPMNGKLVPQGGRLNLKLSRCRQGILDSLTASTLADIASPFPSPLLFPPLLFFSDLLYSPTRDSSVLIKAYLSCFCFTFLLEQTTAASDFRIRSMAKSAIDLLITKAN